MRASIVIPSYNRPELVVRTVRSIVTRNVAREDYEVIVVDDHSEPPVAEAFRGWRLPASVRILRCEENRGRAGARNAGIRAARGDVIILLDDDMEVAPAFLDAHLKAHGASSKVVALGKIVASRELGKDPFFRYLDSRGPEKIPKGGSIPSRYFVTGNSSLPRDALDEVGLFDEEFTLYGGEDTELGIRLGKAGYTFMYVPEGLAEHLDIAGVDDLCHRLVAYGRDAVPRMVERHPELKSELGLGILDPPEWGKEPFLRSLKKAVFQKSMTPGTFRAVGGIVNQKWLGRCLYPLYDYLRAYSYMTGYLEAMGKRQ